MKRPAAHVLSLLLLLFTAVPAEAQRRDPSDRFFQFPGVEFSKEQQAKVEEIRKRYLSQLMDNQQAMNDLLTDEQRQAQREAYREARAAGKEGRELGRAVSEAVKLTDKQRRQRAEILEQREELLAKIRGELFEILTAEQRRGRRPVRRRGDQPATPPTHADVKYGPHRRNVMDVWLAESEKPTPVLISIHGGGFRAGNKSVSGSMLRQCLDSGISVVAITYRFSAEAIAPAQFHDAARAVQFVRHKAKEWNLDPTRIASSGGSAGAGLSLWLGFHDDLADPDNEDPVLRESTRLTCMMVSGGQTSYDPRFIRKLFPEHPVYNHSALAELFDVDLDKLDDLPEEKYRLFEEVSPITHLTKDDPPALLLYGSSVDTEVTNVNVGIHHARFGKVLKERMDELGIRCVVMAGGSRLGGGDRVNSMEFMLQQFGMTE